MYRTDLETIRTMADQVRRRERGKKRELLLLRQQWRVRAGLVPDGADGAAAGASDGSAALPRLPLEPPPDREARLANKAAAAVAREAATLISAQVMIDPSSPGDQPPWDAEPGPSSRQAEKRESLHKPGAFLPSSSLYFGDNV